MTSSKQVRFKDYLGHMLDATHLALSYVEGLSKDDFIADRKTQQAVLLNLMIIGEAASQLGNECEDFVSRHPAIPWREMRGMRNRLAHGYFEVNLDVVWETIRTSLPELEQKLKAIKENY